jgi:hypothetical protein
MAAYFTFKNAAANGSDRSSDLFAWPWSLLRGSACCDLRALFGALLFVANSIAYFLGSLLFYSFSHNVGLLVWGPFYGFFLGAGLGAILYIAQPQRTGDHCLNKTFRSLMNGRRHRRGYLGFHPKAMKIDKRTSSSYSPQMDRSPKSDDRAAYRAAGELITKREQTAYN